MTRLNVRNTSRTRTLEPAQFIGALPMQSNQDSIKRWEAAIRTLFNSLPTTYRYQPLANTPLPERLFDALAAFKQKTSIIAAGHFDDDERARLFRQLDSLLDVENWDSSDAITTEASFTTLLRLVLFLGGRRPALGSTSSGNFIATWTEGGDRLTIECRPNDHVRWVLTQYTDGQRESAAGETTSRRLPELLAPYDAYKRWFSHAAKQAAA
jgi:hypothetical protein